jgi:hypothetical protein
MQPGHGFSISGLTGVMAAALASGSPIFAARYSPSVSALAAITRIRCQFTTLTAFTTPVTAGRGIKINRGSAAATTGGTALVPVTFDSGAPASGFTTGAGGDCRIATTASLGGAPTWEADAIWSRFLSHVGAAGGQDDQWLYYEPPATNPIILRPGQLLGIRAAALFDAAGTFQLAVNIDGYELAFI